MDIDTVVSRDEQTEKKKEREKRKGGHLCDLVKDCLAFLAFSLLEIILIFVAIFVIIASLLLVLIPRLTVLFRGGRIHAQASHWVIHFLAL